MRFKPPTPWPIPLELLEMLAQRNKPVANLEPVPMAKPEGAPECLGQLAFQAHPHLEVQATEARVALEPAERLGVAELVPLEQAAMVDLAHPVLVGTPEREAKAAQTPAEPQEVREPVGQAVQVV
jgi:hypothetical protein